MKKFKPVWYKWIEMFAFGVALIIAFRIINNVEFFVIFIKKFFNVISPFLIGLVIAYFLNPPCMRLQKIIKRIKIKFISRKASGLSVAIMYLFIIYLIVLTLSYLLPLLGRNITELAALFPQYLINIINYLNSLDFDSFLYDIDWQTVINSLSIQEILSRVGISIASIGVYAVEMTTGIVKALFSFIISIYLLLYKDSLIPVLNRFAKLFMKESMVNKIKTFFKKLNQIFYKFIFTQFMDACIMGTLSIIVLSIIGVEYAITLGILMLVCNMIPYFGAIFASIVTIIVTILSDGLPIGIITGLCILVLEQIDGNVISPKLMGTTLKINPVWVILAISVGGSYFGVVGMFISVPVAVMIKAIINNFADEKEKKKDIRNEGKDNEEENNDRKKE